MAPAKNGGITGVTVDTVISYLHACELAYLLFPCGYFTYSEGKRIKRNKKYYPIDPGIRNAVVTRTGRVNDLAMRYLMLGDFESLHKLFEKTSDNVLQELALIRTATKMVATGSDPGRGYLNIAYFMNKKFIKVPSISEVNLLSGQQKEPKNCPQMALTETSHDPYFYYQKSLENLKDTSSTTEAKALHYLVECHRKDLSSQTCLWHNQELAKGASKPWFDKLHSKYKDSKWAKKTKYYH